MWDTIPHLQQLSKLCYKISLPQHKFMQLHLGSLLQSGKIDSGRKGFAAIITGIPGQAVVAIA